MSRLSLVNVCGNVTSVHAALLIVPRFSLRLDGNTRGHWCRLVWSSPELTGFVWVRCRLLYEPPPGNVSHALNLPLSPPAITASYTFHSSILPEPCFCTGGSATVVQVCLGSGLLVRGPSVAL